MAMQRASRRADGPHQPHSAPEHQFPIMRHPRASAPGPARLGDPGWPRRLRPISHLSGEGVVDGCGRCVAQTITPGVATIVLPHSKVDDLIQPH